MRRGVRNENNHFARIRPPFHLKRLRECRSDGLGSIATPGRVQARQVLVHLRDVRGEPEVLRHVRVVLRGVVAVRDESDAEVLAGLELARLVNVVADLLDILRRGGDVAPL